ncbi:integrase core domain-containing protein [Corynebacterium pseudodiphtheriticum]
MEIATFEWVNWWNEERLHQSLGYRTPVAVEVALWEQDESREIIENKVNA